MKRLMLIMASSIFILTSFALSGCNTVSGLGKDVQAGGHALTRAANEVKDDR